MIRFLRSSTERILLGLPLLLLLGAGAAGAEDPLAPEELRAKARELLADGYQTELPAAEPERRALPEGDEPAAGAAPARAEIPEVAGGARVVGLLLQVFGVVALLLLLAWIVTAVASARRRRPPGPASSDETAPAPSMAAEAAGIGAGDPAALAAEGRWSEAVHALLLLAIRRVAERGRVALPPSRTSRELVRLLPLPPESREAFAGLVAAVERSLFGGVPAGPEEYQASLERFRAVTGGGAA